MVFRKVIASVLGSSLFFLVSCTASLTAGTKIAAKLDERYMSNGDEPLSTFKVVAMPGLEGKPFQAILLSDLPQAQEENSNLSFLMPDNTGKIDTDYASISYTVINADDTGQEIEVIEQHFDGDNTIWSRYKANATTVSPVFSKMFYIGYMFTAFPFAFVFALALYALGRYMKKNDTEPVPG